MKRKGGLPKTLILVIIEFFIIVILFSYIVSSQYASKKQGQENQAIYQRGLQDGFAQAVIQVIQQSGTCNPVPLFAGNATANLINIACLQQ